MVFVATDLDRGPIRDWTDRSLLVAAVLNLPVNEQANATGNQESYGYNDLAGQLRAPWTCFRACISCRFSWWPSW